MFEFDKYDAGRPGLRTEPKHAYEPFAGGRKRAFLLWGEHCIECAAPDCFATCDLYDARPDERCRRFDYGIYRNRRYPAARGYGAEVVFRRWGKIEARGNATMISSGFCTAMERGISAGLPLLNGLGTAIRRLGTAIRWSYIAFGALERFNAWLLKRRDPRSRPDAFVAEIYNPGASAVALVFGMAVDRSQIGRALSADQLPRPFSQRLTVEPGYNRFDIPAGDFMEILESGLPFGMALIPDAADGSHLVFLSLDLLVYAEEQARPMRPEENRPGSAKGRPAAKCVVFDLDNTIWDGVLLEGEVALKAGVAELFAALDERGILISLASKNSHDDAMARLKAFGLDHYPLFPQIGWAQKSKGIAAIAERLSINFDTFVFLDDSAFEREEVARAHPQVEVLPETALADLLAHPRLKGSATSEARQRRVMYRDAIERDEASLAFGDDYMAFLKSCEIVVEIMPVTEEHLERVIELVQRTNQLNFSGRKYSREAVLAVLEDPSYDKHVLACSDRFGSYGVVGFALTQAIERGIKVEDFMLSCRVQGKLVEQALFDHLVRRRRPPAEVLEVNYRRTERNGLAQAVLRKLGFPVDDETGGPLRRELGPEDLAVDFLTVIDRTLPEQRAAV